MSYEEIFAQLVTEIQKYHPSNDISRIEKAYLTAKEAHGEQLRKSGEPYIIHPLAVAVILAELEMDMETIIAGILHDVIEDTKFTYEDLEAMFSHEIADLVDGVTKLEKIEQDTSKMRGEQPADPAEDDSSANFGVLTPKEELQAENYRKMFLAMAKDIRVIIIKIADRLHNLRTLKHMSPGKQKEKARETIEIYAPLAHRLGISKIRYEMEDLSFRYLNPDAYYDLADKISRKQSERTAFVDHIVQQLRAKLDQEGIDAYVEGRPKHFFSIYKKMMSQNKTLDQIYDLFAVRVIVDRQGDCYDVLGITHEMWKPVPGRIKDYIAMPKSNKYQSLHTTLIGDEGEPFEIQIRTWDMHRIAEYGIAAHWKYKEGSGGESNDLQEEKLAWLRQILDWQRDLQDNREYLDALRLDLDVFKDHVYCFTPKGEIVSLVNGSTPIDFAYAIHSAVGNKMIGARVNGKMENFDYVLKTGDRVDILTSQNSKGPNLDWLKIVKSSQARSKINQWFKKENKDENIIKGKDLLDKEAKKKGLVLEELMSEKRVAVVLNRFSLRDWNSLCAAVGHGSLKEGQVVNRLHEEYQREQEKLRPAEIVIDPKTQAPSRKRKHSDVIIRGVGEVDVRFSKCCCPVPGDEIVAFTTRGRGVSVHRSDCINMINLDELDRHRLLPAEWNIPQKSAAGTHFRADLRIICDDQMTLLVDISRILGDEKISVKALNARSTNGKAIFNIGIEIVDRPQFDRLCDRIVKLKGVQEIERVTT